MNYIQKVLLVCAGSDKNVLKRTPTELNKHVGIGATILFTGLLAAIASGYAIYTVFNSYVISIIFGMVWGLMIFNLDRYIVSSMRKSGVFYKDFLTAVPRIGLAILIAMVIAKPLELKIFESEINTELALMHQEKLIEQEAVIKQRYESDITDLKSDILVLKQEVQTKTEMRDKLVNEALIEADGTGGSQKRNMGPIYAVKKAEADKAQEELELLTNTNGILINDKNSKLNELQSKLSQSKDNLNQTIPSGFASRIEALERLGNKSNIIALASFFIMLLFIAIETAPIFIKLITSQGPYDLVLDKHELAFIYNHKQYKALLASKVDNKIKFEERTMDYKTNIAIEAEKEMAKKALLDHLESIKDQPLTWKDLIKNGKLFQIE